MESTPRAPRVRPLLIAASLVVVVCAGLAPGAIAQPTPGVSPISVGTNVNMVGGPASISPGPPLAIFGDPYLQRQNEPSFACSSRNPLNCLAAANDYRLVGTPGVQDGKVTGDAWIGIFWSHDEGLSWRSTLLPGHPQDTSPAALAFPLRGRDAAADPVVRAGTNGLFYLSGIAFNRNPPPPHDDDDDEHRDGNEGKTGGVFVSMFVDDNNAQTLDTPIRYVRSSLVEAADQTEFLDKPWIAVDIPRAGAGTCVIPGSGGTASQTVPAGNLYIAYSKFYGPGPNAFSDLLFRRSTDCGKTWSRAVALYHSATTIGQGVSLTVNPATGDVLVAWREFGVATVGTPGRIMVARSTDAGQTFSAGVQVVNLGAVNPTPPSTDPPAPGTLTSSAFDQPTLPATGDPAPLARMFRTNGYPTVCADTTGRYRLAWAQRWPSPEADSRIVVVSSSDGLSWSSPATVDNHAGRGHQFMPAIACSADGAAVAWYDQRGDSAPLVFGSVWFGMFIFDPIPAPPAHTIDVRVAESDVLDPSGRSFLPSTQVSRYLWAVDTTPNPGGPSDINGLVQLEFNQVNWPLFAGGQVPFLGDYIDLVLARTFKAPIGAATGWTYNADPNDTRVLHVAWTDNRDIVKPEQTGDWTVWAPPGEPGCAPVTVSNRNQNVYTSRLSRGLVVGAEGNSRLVASTGITQRAFAVFVQNATTTTRHFRLTAGDPPGGAASFKDDQALGQLLADIAPLSTIARTVFVPASQLVPVVVTVTEIDASGGPVAAGLTGTAVINSDGTAPPPVDGTVATVELHTPTISEALVSSYPNPAYQNPTFINPTFINPTFINPTFINPTFINPTFINPTFINPTFINPTFINPTFINPTFINPTFINQPFTTDVSWEVTNAGNVASGFNFSTILASLPANATFQLIINRLYATPGSNNCGLGQQFNADIQAVINNPVLQPASGGNPLSQDVSNATFALAAGASAVVTLRVTHDGTFAPGAAAAQTVSQADNTDGSTSVARSAPAIGVPSAGVTAQATGPGGANVAFTVTAVDATNTPLTPVCTPTSGSAFAFGATIVSCTATDPVSGKSSTSSFTVTVEDTTPPAITVPVSVTAEAAGASGATVTFVASALDLVDGAVSPVTCSPASGATFALGATTVNCSASDSRGNTGSATFAVTVRDTTPPVVTVPGPVTAEAAGAAGSAVTYTGAAASDVVDGVVAPVSCAPASGAVFPIGTTIVTCSATDAAGNKGTATFAVTVRDTTPPAVTVPAAIVAAAASASGAAVTFGATAADLVSPSVTVTCAPASGTVFPIGTTTVTCSASDAAGNAGTGTFTVTVRDATPPVVTVPEPIVAEATSALGAAVTYTASAADAISPNVAVTCVPASGAVFPLGPTTVTCSSTDAAGNTGQGTFTITVIDATPPVITVPAAVSVAAASPTGTVVTFTASAQDGIEGAVPVTCTPTSGSLFPIGNTSVSCAASDTRGNVSAEAFTVTVQVTTAPVIKFHADVTVAATKPSGVAVTYVLPASTDQFGKPATTTCTPASGSVFAVGSTPVKCDAVDKYGNHAIPTSFNVIVTFAGPTTVTIRVTPGVLWCADDRIVPVNVRGRLTSSAGIASATYTLQDSQGLLSLSGPVKFGPKGWYSFILRLPASRLESDARGRRLVITVTATSKTGVVGSAKATVLVPHDSR
jgi:hypothetical protein